jgi:hypothetical protein
MNSAVWKVGGDRYAGCVTESGQRHRDRQIAAGPKYARAHRTGRTLLNVGLALYFTSVLLYFFSSGWWQVVRWALMPAATAVIFVGLWSMYVAGKIPNRSPGWYRDPTHEHHLRYLARDGWTDHVAD